MADEAERVSDDVLAPGDPEASKKIEPAAPVVDAIPKAAGGLDFTLSAPAPRMTLSAACRFPVMFCRASAWYAPGRRGFAAVWSD